MKKSISFIFILVFILFLPSVHATMYRFDFGGIAYVENYSDNFFLYDTGDLLDWKGSFFVDSNDMGYDEYGETNYSIAKDFIIKVGEYSWFSDLTALDYNLSTSFIYGAGSMGMGSDFPVSEGWEEAYVWFTPPLHGIVPGHYVGDNMLIMDITHGSFDHGDVYFGSAKGHEQYLTIRPVPEPATILLLGAGLVGLAGFGRKKFKK